MYLNPVNLTFRQRRLRVAGSLSGHMLFLFAKGLYFKPKVEYFVRYPSKNKYIQSPAEWKTRGFFESLCILRVSVVPGYRYCDGVQYYSRYTYIYLLNAVYRTIDPATNTSATRFPIKKKKNYNNSV